AETDNLDALASRGIRFDRAYAPVPLTIPSHSTLFTGLLPPRHGVHTNGDAVLSEEATTLAERLQAAGYQTHAAVAAYVTQSHWGFGQGFDGYDDDLGLPTDRLSWKAERRAEAVVDDALAALQSGADFLWVHVFDAHAPYDPPEGYSTDRPYDGELAYIDDQLGRLIEAIPENAIIIVSGDHGEAFDKDGETEHGLLLTEGVLRVPLLLIGPDIAPGVVSEPVSLADVTPTLLRLLDLPFEDDLDGTDLLQPAPRAGVYSEAMQGAYIFGWAPLRALTTAEGRLIKGARVTTEGTLPDDTEASLDAIAAATPAWEVNPLTLDEAQIEQLQALGYLASAPSEPVVTGQDPRDGIATQRTLRTLGTQPPAEQESTLRAVLTEHPRHRDARFRLGRLLASTGRLNEAISQTEEAYRISPDSSTAAVTASMWLQIGDPGEALQWYREALLHDPRSLNARAGEVDAMIQLGRLDEARVMVDEYLDKAPDHGRMLLAGATLALAEGGPTDTWLEPVTELARKRPYEAPALQVAAALHQAAGDPETAIELLRQELRWRPYNTAARLELAVTFREQRRLVDVLKTIRPLLTTQPDEPRWHAIAAEVYLEMGRTEDAAPHLEACAGTLGCPEPG
ncbi:MAG: choline-sulfatase, partial [Myxococcota bacterium]